MEDNMKTDLQLIEERHPLVHNITNYVAMNMVANSLLAIGASPIMARSPREVEEIAANCDALALNLGTLEVDSAQAMILAGKSAFQHHKPIVFDPVGVGATAFRRNSADIIIKTCHPTVIKGNAAEIMALYTHQIGNTSIDSSVETGKVESIAKQVANNLSCVIVVSGSKDIITDGTQTAYVTEGHSLMARVTAMGCTATGIIGAFLAINPDSFDAALHAMQAMGLAGKRAGVVSRGNGSMMINFLDELSNLQNG